MDIGIGRIPDAVLGDLAEMARGQADTRRLVQILALGADAVVRNILILHARGAPLAGGFTA